MSINKNDMIRIIVTCIMFVTVCLSWNDDVFAEVSFAKGTGTKDDPYQIETKEQLDAVRNNVKAYYVLANDIAFDDADFQAGGMFYNNGQGWCPIGVCAKSSGGDDNEKKFSGVFDGKGHKIINLQQNIITKNPDYTDNNQASGLFDSVSGTVQNVIVEDADIKVNLINGKGRKSGVYAIIASNNCGWILNCCTSGKLVVNSDGIAGGLVGYNEGLVANCTNDANIEVSYLGMKDVYTMVGGVVGSCPAEVVCCINRGSIKIGNCSDGYAGGIVGGGGYCVYYCVNKGDVDSSVYAAGISAMGSNFRGYGCYNIGGVKGKYAGGIVGEVGSGHTDQCYNAGEVSGQFAGGFAAKAEVGNLEDLVPTNCYFSNAAKYGFCGKEEFEGLTAFDTKNIAKKETFNGFDYDNIWNITSEGPVLKDTVFEYYKQHYKMFDYNLGQYYHGTFNQDFVKTDYYVGEKIDLSGIIFTGWKKAVVVKESEAAVKNCVFIYSNMYDSDPIYIDDDTMYFEKEDGSDKFYITLIDPDDIEVSGFDTSVPTTKPQKVTVKYYKFTGTYKINVKEKPHIHEEDKGTIVVAADCVNTGLLEYRCEGCGEVVRTQVVSALGHDFKKISAVEATTSREGNIEYYLCLRCNKYFSDSYGVNEIAEDSWVIPVIKENTSSAEDKKNLETGMTEEKKHNEVSTVITTEVSKEIQTISVKKLKQYKTGKLKNKKVVIRLNAKTTGDGKLTYKILKGSKKIYFCFKNWKNYT